MEWLWTSIIEIICGGLLGFVIGRFMVWLKKPKPVSRHEIRDLREKATTLYDMKHAADTTKPLRDIAADIDRKMINEEKRVHYLRAYVEFGKENHLLDIRQTLNYMTFAKYDMKTTVLTQEHIDLFQKFKVEEHEMMTAVALRKGDISETEVFRPVITYGFKHPELAPTILSIVKTRQLYSLDEIKPLLQDMEASQSKALNEGVL